MLALGPTPLMRVLTKSAEMYAQVRPAPARDRPAMCMCPAAPATVLGDSRLEPDT